MKWSFHFKTYILGMKWFSIKDSKMHMNFSFKKSLKLFSND